MSAFHPRLEDLPTEFPVFPLSGALLLPQGKLPLNIFEPRYLAMVEDSLGQGRMFGMIQPDRALGSGPNGPSLYHIGCLGRLSSFQESEDGRYLITLSGLIRFQILEEIGMARGYRRVLADFSKYARDLDTNPAPIGVSRDLLAAALKAYFSARSLDANWDAIKALSDQALVTTLCMACPFSSAEKQALLEAEPVSARAAVLLALLEMGSHESGEDDRPHNIS